MCDQCRPVISQGIEALEAHANGETVPQPVSLLAFNVGADKVAIVTNEAGWQALQPLLRQLPGYTTPGD